MTRLAVDRLRRAGQRLGAARRVVRTRVRVARFLVGVFSKRPPVESCLIEVNGEPAGLVVQASRWRLLALEGTAGTASSVQIIANPDKLACCG